MNKITPFLMFEGRAEEALKYYSEVFRSSEIINITRYDANEAGSEGSIKLAEFELNGQRFMCIDSPARHDFTFTASVSFFVNCELEIELDKYYTKLSAGGQVFMPLDNYGFSEKFGWVADKFGVSWQLNLEKPLSSKLFKTNQQVENSES